jgi:hypothetical protein
MQFALMTTWAISLNYKHHSIWLTSLAEQNIYVRQCCHAKATEQETGI